MAKKNTTGSASVDAGPVVEELPLDAAAAPPAPAAVPAAVADLPAAVVVAEPVLEQSPLPSPGVPAALPTSTFEADAAASAVPGAAAATPAFNSAPLYVALGAFGQRLEAEAERVANEAIHTLDAKFHSPALIQTVREATHRLAVASVGRIGATPDEIAALATIRDEAISVIQSFEGHGALVLEEVVVKGIHRMYAQVQDLASGHLSDVVKHLTFLERLPMAGAIVGAVRNLLAA